MQPFSQMPFSVIIRLDVFYTLFKMDIPASLSHGKSVLQWKGWVGSIGVCESFLQIAELLRVTYPSR